MNNKTKTFIFKTLSFLPGNLGYILYHNLQNISQSNNLEIKLKSAEKTFNELKNICLTHSIQLKDKTILEIGSGWIPSLPYLFLYNASVKKVLTYDINKHYQEKNLRRFNQLFAKKKNVVLKIEKNSLPKEIQYFPNENVINCKDKNVDLIFSRFVFEHVSPKDILLIHEKFKENFKKGTTIIHFISPSDHRAYSDKSLSLQDFLKYSKKEWDGIQTKFDYHNRLRFSEFIKIFKELNMEIIYQNYSIPKKDSKQYKLFKKLTLHKDYKTFSEEDLLAGSIVIILKI